MNTHGHHAVADKAGIPFLKEAFREHNPAARFGAFYLGNWLTDVAQAFDPVAGKAGQENINQFIDSVYAYIPTVFEPGDTLPTLLPFGDRIDKESLTKALNKQRDMLKRYFNAFFTWFMREDSSGVSPWIAACEQSFFLKGYFKFVHPEKPGQPLQMDMDAYIAVFDEFYTQYWPHDHMDRPENPPGANGVKYDTRVSNGPIRGPQQYPDVYTYIREYTEVIAGTLTELDLNWASLYLRLPHSVPTLDEDIAWNLGLARLGKALHGVEDFFAHSNWVEHAAKVMGSSFIPHAYQYDNWRFLKRLKRLTTPDLSDNWQDAPDEEFVVSGYFDFRDTAVSLLHLLEDSIMGWIGVEPKEIGKEVRQVFDFLTDIEGSDKKVVEEADKVVFDMLELMQEPQKILTGAEGNTVRDTFFWFVGTLDGEDLQEQIETFSRMLFMEQPQVEDFRPLLERLPVFRDIETMSDGALSVDHVTRLYQALLLYARYMTMKREAGPIVVSLFQILKKLVEFYFLPHRTAKKWLKKQAFKRLADYVSYYAKEAIFDAMAADRVGCHSLMSKDHGSEWLFEHMQNCSMAAHHYIVKTLLRWREPEYRDNQRAPDECWVDWLHLVEHFIQHPAVGVVYTKTHPIPTSIFHDLTEAQRNVPLPQLLKELSDIYLPRTYKVTGLPFDEKSILHGNITTMVRKLNPIAVGEMTVANAIIPGSGAVLALRRLVIPHIRYHLGVADPTKVNPKWYMAVLLDDWKVAKTTNLLHNLRFYESRQWAEAEVVHANLVLQQLKERYQP